MYTDMEMWRDIRRRVLVDGESKRSVMRHYGIHYQTLEKILRHSEPPGYRMERLRGKPKLGPFVDVVASILEADKTAPRKQRHTAKRIFDRLRDEYGYSGGYTVVRQAVHDLRRQRQEVFMPLAHDPGTAQVDFGFAKIDFPGGRQKVALFVMTLPYSDALFICAFPHECTEAFQQGHVWAFEYFGGVPKRISYDNSKIAVITVGQGRERRLTDDFIRLQSHHLFKEHFCLVRRPNEKGHVETHVSFARNNFLVPVPYLDDYAALNWYLLDCCEKDLQRRLRGKQKLKAELLAEEKAFLLPLPKQRFEARRIEKTRANSLSLVRFHCNSYSVPTEYAYREVTVVGGIDEVKLIVGHKLVARHPRSWDKEGHFFDPVHYLRLLERKPGAIDVAKPLQNWDLPECFDVLRRRMENGPSGLRDYIKVLRLLEKATKSELAKAIEKALSIGAADSEAIRLILETQKQPETTLFSLDGRPHLKSVVVADVDLGMYQSLTGAMS